MGSVAKWVSRLELELHGLRVPGAIQHTLHRLHHLQASQNQGEENRTVMLMFASG